MPHFVTKKIKGTKYLYIAWRKRFGKKTKTIKQLYLGSAEKVAQLLEQPFPKFKSYSYGEIALLLHVATLTDFVSIANKHMRKIVSIGDYLLLPVINRLLKPRSKQGIKEWYEKTCLPIIKPKGLSLSSQNYWYYLNRVSDENINNLWKDIVAKVKSNLKANDNNYLYDTTNFFTYMEEHIGNTLLQYGHSKQKRNDKRQVCLSLLIGEQSQLPYWFETYPGNINDKTRFVASPPKIDKKIGTIPQENVTLIFDKGNNSPESFKAIKDYYFIGSLQHNCAETQDLLDAEPKYCFKNNKNNEIRSASKKARIYDIESKVVISFNAQLRKKQLHSLEAKISKTNEKFDKIRTHLFETERAAINKMHEILPKKQNPFDYEIKKKGNKFMVIMTLNQKKKAWYERIAGKNIIFTNHIDWNDERIIKAYLSMYKVENEFKLLHGAWLVSLKPIFHWTDRKIRAHIFLCMVSLLFAKVLEYICRDKIKGGFRKILDFASTIRLALVQREGKPQLVFEELTPQQQALMEAFSLSNFVKTSAEF